MIAEIKPAPGMNIAISFGIALVTTASTTNDDDAADDLILESGEFVFNDFPRRCGTTVLQRHNDVEESLEALS